MQPFMALLDQRNHGILPEFLHHRGCDLGRKSGLLAMAQAVDRCEEESTRCFNYHVLVTSFLLALQSGSGNPPLNRRGFYLLTHFRTVTCVPQPNLESISNSSIKRLTPDSPKPRLREVE